jgi:peptidoglycan/LPS O-acetylase OafA/YrhL
LRAVAVLAVLVFHGFPELLPAGFLGVDIFFVISGFVITRGLLHARGAGALSFGDFYARRIRRLFPALALVLGATLALGWFVLLPDEFSDMAELAVAAGASLANVQLLRESGYFDAANSTKPLMHLWSLGVEEQFYLLWPLVFAWLAPKRTALAWVVCGALASLALEAVWISDNAAGAFYHPLPRAWELLAGVALAWIPSGWRSPRWLGGFGVAALGLALCSSGAPSLHLELMILGVAGTASVIAAGTGDQPARWLSAPPLQWLGRISYPLYLWHWPVIALRNLLGSAEAEAPGFTAAWLLTAVALADLTHRFIERPIAARPTRRTAAWCAVALVAPVVMAVAVLASDGLPDRAIARVNWKAGTGKLRAGKEFTVAECISTRKGPLDMHCARDAGAPPNAVVWGDSKAEALFWGFVRESQIGSDRWMLIGSSGCPRGDDEVGSPTCAQGRPLVWEALAGPQIKTVLLVSAVRSLRDEDQRRHFEEAVTGLVERGKAVVLVADNPTVTGEHEAPASCARELAVPFLDEVAKRRTCKLPLTQHLADTASYREWLQRVAAAHPGVRLFDMTPLLCDTQHNICPVAKDGKLLYSYGDHVSDAGNELVAREMRRWLKERWPEL